MSKSLPNRPRRSPTRKENTFVTKSGKTIKVNRSLSDRVKAGREAKARRKAAYLSSLPSNRWKRLLYRLNPRRMAKYWFSRDGAIMALKIAGVGIVIGFLLLVGVFAYFRKDLPEIKDISGNTFGGSITYYDRTGQTVLFEDYDSKKRVPVADDNISDYMRWATIAIEDKNFYEHGAFDTRGIIRAIVNDLTGAKGGRQGGSTITQQLVKINEDWGNDRTISRKVKELILAVELEREYSKDEILTGYLNMAPYGNIDYGVETAAQDYFGVSAKDLTIAQAATLASIPKSPTALSPFSSPEFNPALATNYFDQEALLVRKDYIIGLMAEQGYITDQEAKAAKEVDVLGQVKPLNSQYANIKAPYFVFAARQELLRSFPKAVVKRGGWKVITTLDMKVQSVAETAYNNGQAQLRRQNADNAAFVAEDTQSGQIVALIGGRGIDTPGYGEINYASDVNLSPGSSIKPYDYVTLIDNNTNVGAGSVLYDQIGPLPGYPCTNRALPPDGNCLWDFDRRSPGPVTIRYALGGSRNITAVKAFLSAVPNDTSTGRTTSASKVMSTIAQLMQGNSNYRCFNQGVDITQATKADEVQCGGSAGIGDGAYLHLDEHVNGIASISRLGKAIPRTYIMKVTNSSGKVLKEYKKLEPVQAVKPDAAYIVNDMASDPGASYLSGNCNETNCYGMKFHRYKGWKTGIKTGTTNDLYDGLLVAWNTKYTVGMWVGNHSRTTPYDGQPEFMTVPIVREFMQKALDDAGPAVNWEQPSGIKTASAYVNRRVITGAQTVPSRSTDLYPSWYVGKTTNSSQVIDKVSGKLATSCTPELAKQSSLNSNATSWNVDVFAGGSTGGTPTAQGNDDVHNCNDAKPTAEITAINGVGAGGASLSCPEAGCTVMVHVQQGTYPLTDGNRPNFPGSIALLANGQTVQTQAVGASGDYQFTYVPPADSSESIQLTAQVTDSVLYQGIGTTNLTVTKTPPVSSGNGSSGNTNRGNNSSSSN